MKPVSPSPPPPSWLGRFWLAFVAPLVVVGALLALPPSVVERWYSSGAYPVIQGMLTRASNLLPFAAFDAVVVMLIGSAVAGWVSALRSARRLRSWGGVGRACAITSVGVMLTYIWFLLVWGLNYQRPPLETRLALTAGAPAEHDILALLERAVSGANADYVAAHAEGFPSAHDVPDALADSLHRVERRHGRPAPTVPGRPKPTVLSHYFRMAGVDGLTAPAALETLLNADLTGPERPFVLAHEWAHLSGYAPEADANFVAWLTTQDAGVSARYSAWIFLMSEAAAQLPAAVRRPALGRLSAGPRDDLAAISRRAEAKIDVVQRLGWRAYDGYLRSQGVGAGVADYSRVLELIVRYERGPPP